MPSIELKPCPFCGGEAEFDGDSRIGYWVECLKCGTTDPLPNITWSMEEAAEAWNTRAERTCRAIPHDNLNESEGMGDAWEVCSECGALLAVITDNQQTPNYCPNCGAKVVDA